MDFPTNIPKNPDLARMSYATNMPGISTGHAPLDIMISMLLSGMSLPAIPGKGQSVYDAMQQRDRSRDYLKLMQQGFGEQLLLQKLGGMDMNSTLGRVTSMMFGRPDGVMDSSIMRAFNGGNPVKAMMGLNADMTGQTMGTLFGTNANATTQEVTATFDSLQKQFYNQHRIDTGDVAKAAKMHSKELRSGFGKNKDVDNFFKEFETEDENGNKVFDFASFKTKAKDYAEKATKTANKAIIDAYADVLKRSESIEDIKTKIGKQVATSVDGKATRGFQFDQLTKVFSMDADLGLVYDPNSRFNKNAEHSPELARKATEGFANVTKVLAAVRDITGSEDAVQANNELNALLGNSTVRLNDAGQASRITDMLRRYKAAAKTIGISQEAMDGMLAVNKQVMSQFESLKYVGGTSAIETTIRAGHNAAAFISTMGPDYLRRNGGQAQITQEMQIQAATNMGSPATARLAAAAAQIKNSNLSDSEKEAGYAELSDASLHPETFFERGFAQLADSQAKRLGMSRHQVLAEWDNTAIQQAGQDFMSERDRTGKGLNLDESAISADVADFMQSMRLGLTGQSIDGKKVDVDKTIQGVMEGLSRGDKKGDLVAKYHLGKSISEKMQQPHFRNVELYAARHNDNFRRERDFLKTTTGERANDEERMAEKFHMLQAPLLQGVVQELISGNYGKGMAGLSGIFATDGARDRSSALMGAAKDLRSDNSDANFKAAFFQLHGGEAGLSDDTLSKNLSASYITDSKDQASIKDQREAFTDEGLTNLTDVSKKLSMNEIAMAGANWKKSRAKELGMSQEAVARAAAFLKKTGLGSDENMAQYGDKSFNDVRRNIMLGSSIAESGRMAQADVVADIEKNSGESFGKYFDLLKNGKAGETAEEKKAREEQYNKLHGALDTLGLIDHPEGWFGGEEINTTKAMEEINKDKILNGMSADKLVETYGKGQLSEDTQKALVKAGIAKQYGKEINIDKDKLRDQERKENAVETLKGSSILNDGASSIKKAIKASEAGREAAKTEYGQNAMTTLNSTLGTSSQSITSAIEKLVDMLRSFNGGGA
jgi:hypothetical protein